LFGGVKGLETLAILRMTGATGVFAAMQSVRGARIEAAEVVVSAEVGADAVAGVINGDVVFAGFAAHG
jgi:hypothetical protein